MARVAVLAVVATLALPVAGQSDVERSFALAAGGEVDIEIPQGRLVVRGWDRDEVRVTGRIAADPDRVEIASDGESLRIEIAPNGGGSHVLELTVPTLAVLDIEAIACDVRLEGVRIDEVDIEIVHGDITVDGEIGRIDIEAISGTVKLGGSLERVEVESAAGGVEVVGVTRTVEIESVSGPLDVVAQAPLVEVDLSSASGGIRFEGALREDGALRAESLNGNVELRLPADTRADFELETFNGEIEIDWEGVELQRYVSGVERAASFSIGGGGATVEVETFNGNCVIRRR